MPLHTYQIYSCCRRCGTDKVNKIIKRLYFHDLHISLTVPHHTTPHTAPAQTTKNKNILKPQSYTKFLIPSTSCQRFPFIFILFFRVFAQKKEAESKIRKKQLGITVNVHWICTTFVSDVFLLLLLLLLFLFIFFSTVFKYFRMVTEFNTMDSICANIEC